MVRATERDKAIGQAIAGVGLLWASFFAAAPAWLLFSLWLFGGVNLGLGLLRLAVLYDPLGVRKSRP